MSTLVSTGQITIVDTNDSRSITAAITADGPLQQTYTPDGATPYKPDRTQVTDTGNGKRLTLTARVSLAGTNGATQWITSDLTSTTWSYDAPVGQTGTALIASNSTSVVLSQNMDINTPNRTIYFEGTWTDATTGLTSHITAVTTISVVKTGTNATYVRIDGKPVIKKSLTGTSKQFATITARLMAGGAESTDTLSFKWYKFPYGKNDVLDSSLSGITNYGFVDTAGTDKVDGNGDPTPITPVIGSVRTTTNGTQATISSSNLADDVSPWTTFYPYKTLAIGEDAVAGIGNYRVKIKDSSGNVYQADFSIFDASDSYAVRVLSTAGDKLQNGIGSTVVYPTVYSGATLLTDTTGWTFDWYFYDKQGKQCGFVDVDRSSGGRVILSNTASTFTFATSTDVWQVGDIVKCVKTNGLAFYYEVLNATTTSVTIRTTGTFVNSFIQGAYTNPSAGEFVNGVLYACTRNTSATVNGVTTSINGTRTVSGGLVSALAGGFTLDEKDIDVKGNIVCNANKP